MVEDQGLTAPQDRPEPTPQELKLAWANLDRALVHVPDAQICGIWPDGSSVRGEHIKFLITQLREVAVPARAHHEEKDEKEKDALSRVDGERLLEGHDLPRKTSTGDK